MLARAASGQEPPAAVPPDTNFPQNELRFPSEQIRFPRDRIAAPMAGGGNELRFRLTADLLFDFDRANLRPQAEGVLRDVAAQARQRFPRGQFRVEGHTDAIGNDSYNDALSLRRADAVRRWLTQAGGVPAGAIQVAGLGRRQPVAPNQRPDGRDDPIGRQQNRRVEIVVTAAGRQPGR